MKNMAKIPKRHENYEIYEKTCKNKNQQSIYMQKMEKDGMQRFALEKRQIISMAIWLDSLPRESMLRFG